LLIGELFLDKDDVIHFLRADHDKLEEVIIRLSEEQMTNFIIIGNWSTKDIIAHISAWILEITKSIDQILMNVEPWYANEKDLTEREFNKREILKRKSWSIDEVLEEWRMSFESQINRIESLTNKEWVIQTDLTWRGGSPITLSSLFGYRYKGAGHEGGHAIQIKKYFNL
jgi:hypothetical protein